MELKNRVLWVALLAFGSVLCGCSSPGSATTGSPPTAKETNGKSEQKTTSEDNDRAAKKISMAISEEVGEFTITGQQSIEAPTGYNGIQYTVKTKGGKTYKCEILEPSGFGKAMTWGMAGGAGAMCTDFTKGSKDKGKANKAGCNDLLRATGKC